MAFGALGRGGGALDGLAGLSAVLFWSPLVAWVDFVPGLPLARRAGRAGRSTLGRATASGAGCGLAVGAATLLVDAIARGGVAGLDALGGLLWIGLSFAAAGAVYAAIFLGWLRLVARAR